CRPRRVRGRPIEANREATVRKLVTRQGDGDLSRLLGALSNILDGYTHGYSIMELPFGKLGDADCKGAEGLCRRGLPKGTEEGENDRSFLCRFPQTAPNC
ncbi:unnamed protein product, partial [Prunus brigantina]